MKLQIFRKSEAKKASYRPLSFNKLDSEQTNPSKPLGANPDQHLFRKKKYRLNNKQKQIRTKIC